MEHFFVCMTFCLLFSMSLCLLVLAIINAVVPYLIGTSQCDRIIVPLRHAAVESIRGNQAISSRLVVFSKNGAGFANNMMGLLSTYAVAIALDAPLACMCIPSVTYSPTRLSFQ